MTAAEWFSPVHPYSPLWKMRLARGPRGLRGTGHREVPSMLEGSAVFRPIALDTASASSEQVSCRERRGGTKALEG